MREPGRAAIGTWSGGRFLHFGEAIDEGRPAALLRPGDGIDTVLTADAYGQGEADEVLGRALEGAASEDYCLVGAVGHDFYEGERDGPRGFPRFTDPPCGVRTTTRATCGWRPSAASNGSPGPLRPSLLHNPDRTGYESEVVWDGMAALREAGLASQIGVAPGPANGFTLDLIRCLERYGDRIDWAMVILNPLEPWPGELALGTAAEQDVGVITRVVDYGGLFWDDLLPGAELAEGDHRAFRPDGWIERGRERLERMRPSPRRRELTPMQLACQWNLSHPAVRCVVPTLIQEAGEGARPIEDKRSELAALPAEQRLSAETIAEIREIGDNTGSMALKGASPDHEGDERPDRWGLEPDLVEAGTRWGIDPERDLRQAPASAGR